MVMRVCDAGPSSEVAPIYREIPDAVWSSCIDDYFAAVQDSALLCVRTRCKELNAADIEKQDSGQVPSSLHLRNRLL
jgi:hypothetical protein